MTHEEQKQLVVDTLCDFDMKWWIKAAGGEDAIFAHVLDLMTRFSSAYSKRYKIKAEPFSIFTLRKKRVYQVKAFVQALAETSNIEMLVMVWRIIMGTGIKKIETSYIKETSYTMSIVLESPYGELDNFNSNSIDDAKLLRHLGILKSDGKPVFHGFFALHVPESQSKSVSTTQDAIIRKLLSSIQATLEPFMQNWFSKYLELAKLERVNSMVPLFQLRGDHKIDLSMVPEPNTPFDQINIPIAQSKRWAFEWNSKVVDPNNKFMLYHKERMCVYVGTCIAEVLKQVDILQGRNPPREPSFAGRFYRQVEREPWEH